MVACEVTGVTATLRKKWNENVSLMKEHVHDLVRTEAAILREDQWKSERPRRAKIVRLLMNGENDARNVVATAEDFRFALDARALLYRVVEEKWGPKQTGDWNHAARSLYIDAGALRRWARTKYQWPEEPEPTPEQVAEISARLRGSWPSDAVGKAEGDSSKPEVNIER